MKKLLAIILSVLAMVTLLSVVSLAATVEMEDDYISDGDFMLASFNGSRPFFADAKNPEEVENAAYWLSDNISAFNLKYVSFVGNMSSYANYTHANVVAAGVGNTDDLYRLNDEDTEWHKDFKALQSVADIISESGVPYGISIGKNDYYAVGFDRRNHIQNLFTEDNFFGETSVQTELLDNNNFATIVEVNGLKYIIYQLEAYPVNATLSWFHTVQAKHSDKRAIIFTTSFLDAAGDMYTQHDWVESGGKLPSNYRSFSTNLTSNMLNHGQPHDGINIWNYAIKMYDNILLVVSDNVSVGTNIVSNKFKADSGVEVAAIAADLENGYGKQGLAYPLLIKISADNKTIDVMYGDYNSNKGYIEESKVTLNLKKIGSLPEPEPYTLLPKVGVQTNGSNDSYIKGYEDGTFRPDGNMTKAEASMIFARLLADDGVIPTGNTTRFTDVKEGDWYYDAIAYLDTLGYYYTTEGTEYNPDAEITRAEFVELAFFASDVVSGTAVTFSDVDTTNKYYEAISTAAAAKLINGYGDGSFKPDGNITRAEVVTIINRLVSLLANEKTVGKDYLANKFSDIEGHWAEYTILMAANDDVKGDIFFTANPDSLKEEKKNIVIENDYIKISIAKKNGKITSVINKYNNEEILAVSTSPWFTWLISESGAVIQPSKMEIVDSVLAVTYKNKVTVNYVIDVQPTFITVTLATNLPKNVGGAVICNVPVNSYWELDNENAYGISAISMTTTINTTYYPGGYAYCARGTTYTTLGQTVYNPNANVPTYGSKVGFAFSKMTEHREHLKDLSATIDRSEGIVNTKGGAYAYDSADIYTDYVILSSGLTPETAHETGKICQQYSIDYIDMHQNNVSTFIHGEFNFISARDEREQRRGAFIDGPTFKERVSDIINSYGVKLSLHTFSSLLDSKAETIVTNPVYQKQISYNPRTYTLRGDLSKARKNIKTVEDASDFIVKEAAIPYSTGQQTMYILIDEEIIRVQQGTTSGFLNVRRGQLGTKAVAHEDGAEIRQLYGWYNMFQPQMCTDLFYLVAQNTAKAVNEAGFDMIYFDGFESIGKSEEFSPSGNTRYYFYAEFIREVLENVEEDPLMEMSCIFPAFWGARARGGATDTSLRAYKNHKLAHINSQTQYLKYFYTATVGWQNYDPDMNQQYKDVVHSTMHRDDLDFMGSLSLAYDFSTVCQPFSVAEFTRPTRLTENFGHYGVYSRLRKGNYFAPEVKKAIIAGEYEFKLFQQEDGSFAFKEMTYFKHKIYNKDIQSLNASTAVNPFDSQVPFIRIEQKYSTLYENEQLIIEFDETKPVSELVGIHKIPNVNADGLYAFKIKVKGNGSSTAGIMLRFTGGKEGNTDSMDDRFIPLDFDGWQEIILMEADNDDCYGYNFEGMSYGQLSYAVYRIPMDMDNIGQVRIYTTGDCSGVYIDDIYAYSPVITQVKNPSVTIDDKTMTFNTTVESGEYIEYYPELNKAYLHSYDDVYRYQNEAKEWVYTYEKVEGSTWYQSEAHTEEISFSGSVVVPNGEFTYSYAGQSDSEAVIRAQVEIGVAGAILENPEGWVEPEIEGLRPEDLYPIIR